MAETRPKDYPKLKDYQPTRFMLPTSHYDKAKADRAVKFTRKLKTHQRKMGRETLLAAALAGADHP